MPFDVVVEHAGEGAAEPREVRAALDGVDVVDKRVDLLVVAVVVLEGDLDRTAVFFFGEENRLGVDDALGGVQGLTNSLMPPS